MRLLFDQNISFRVLNAIRHEFPEARHVKDFGLEFSSDRDIWNHAKQHNFTLVTLDADFINLLTLYGFPPKIIWLRTGNTGSLLQASLLLSHKSLLEEFTHDNLNAGCLELTGRNAS
ncbi:MAG: DUF5615 family PIN-like protein [Bacteroidota bacterium]